MITKFKIFEIKNDNPEYLNDLKIGDKIIYVGHQSNYLKEGDIFIINSIVKYSENNGHRYYLDVDTIGKGDLISIKTENGYVINDDDGSDKLFFPNKFTTPEIYNITNDSKKFNL